MAETTTRFDRAALRRRRRKKRGKNKFGAVKTKDGADSKSESRRAKQLRYLERGGYITNLELDKKKLRWMIIDEQVDDCGQRLERAAYYTADASYKENGVLVVEDTKSVATAKLADYVLRRKLMLAVHGIRIKEVQL